MFSSLRARLLLALLVVLAVALGSVWIGVLLVGPGYFADAMGHSPSDPAGLAMDQSTRAAFAEAMFRALLGASLIAIVTAVIISLAVAARVARPVASLATAARRVAAGHYAERVPAVEPDELAELAMSFNAMAASLEETERRRTQLVGDVAHELRTPLATIDGYLEGIEDGVVAQDGETWRLLRSETRRLAVLVNDLTELWRAESKQLTLEVEPISLRDVATEVAQRFAPSAAQTGVTIDVRGHATAIADRNRVTQIVSNYVSNAIRHAPAGTPVTIDLEQRDAALLAVTDSGPGLTREQREAVFLRFYRVDAARSRADGGSGIGLAIVAALAQAMGGRVWAESAGAGKGSTFRLELPGLDEVLMES